jgi:cation diffusion facilitator CzcD-associated flavoprotein CzcO/acetyl esterase/lipase
VASNKQGDLDVAVVGAGFAGLYALHRLRGMGFTARVFEAADDVGGTWYWNRYPGARCDVQSVDYSYTFDKELDAEWTWSEKYAPQPEILRYLQHVATKHDLRRDIQFSTRIESATWRADTSRWTLRTSKGEDVSCKFYVMATGCLSMPKELDINGADNFKGDVYFTSRWPHEGVDFTGKRVAVVGTGSSAIQSIPLIAKQAKQLTVFQRTPNFSIPANNGPTPADKLEALARGRDEYREAARWSGAGVPFEPSLVSALAVSDDERHEVYEKAWERGGIIEFLGVYSDHLFSPEANELLAEFVRNKIRKTVNDPVTGEALCPKDYPIGTKRLCVDSGYYETFNRSNVRLVDIRSHAISTVTATGIDLVDELIEFDAIVFATGFDAMTGAMVAVDITGRDGVTLKDTWAAGPTTYLGLMAAGFPNLFMVTGPGSPSVLSNMAMSIEQHVEWITDCIAHLRNETLDAIEPTEPAVAGWVQHVNDFADLTLMPQANSWYMGANVPGKARVFLPFPGGADRYRTACNEVAAGGYSGFERSGASGVHRDESVIRRMQPDVMILLETIATFQLPPLESMSAVDARAFNEAMSAQRAPGPDVEVIDGVLPGAAGELAYRRYIPPTAGPHPVVVYFHGGGWVLGSSTSDDPLCRDLCARSGTMIVSVNYRHAPEARFPAAVDDAFAATKWIAEHAEALGGIPGRVAVAGWSAGGNLAAVVTQLARDAGGPNICGQMLMTPATDASMATVSHAENAEGYVLTNSLMRWFWDHYADLAQRTDPRASPLLAKSLAGLPPAFIVTCEFDPLRDEGAAYAAALAAAGVPTTHHAARGQIHTSLAAVDVLPSGAPARAEMAAALQAFFPNL